MPVHVSLEQDGSGFASSSTEDAGINLFVEGGIFKTHRVMSSVPRPICMLVMGDGCCRKETGF